jgi:predicted membrane-bound mannosyltransferase
VNERPARPTSVRTPGLPGLEGWTSVLVLGALAWRTLRYALVFPMWGDEWMLAVNFHDRGLLELLEPLDYGQVAPPGFLWLELAASKLLGFSEPALRLVPFLAGAAAVLLFWWACRKLLDRRAALMAIAVFAASFYPLRYAVEVKPYSLDLLLALAIILAAWGVYERPASAGRWTAFLRSPSRGVFRCGLSKFTRG